MVNGKLVQGAGTKPDTWVITVPRSLVGNPPTGSLLQSLSAFTFARAKSASVPITNSEGESGITPVEIDGVCCKQARVPKKPPRH